MIQRYNKLVGIAVYILLFLLVLITLTYFEVLQDVKKVYFMVGFISVFMLFFQSTLLIKLRQDGFKPTSSTGYVLLGGWLLIAALSYWIQVNS